MPEPYKIHKCPTCNRQFLRITDYPKILVTGFERITPSTVRGEHVGCYKEANLPESVRKSFETNGVQTVISEGKIYDKIPTRYKDMKFAYDCCDDVSDIAKLICSQSVVQTSLNTIESYVGKEISPNLIESLPVFEHGFECKPYDCLKLEIFQSEKIGENAKNIIYITGFGFEQDVRIARIEYKPILIGNNTVIVEEKEQK